MVCVYSESFKKYYYSSCLSLPACITIISVIFAIMLPFFTQFYDEKFWEPLDIYYEHPVLRFNEKYIAYALYTTNGDDNSLKSSVFTSIYDTDVDNIFSLSISTKSEEINNDDIIDKFIITVSLKETSLDNTINSIKVKDIKVLLFFDYILQDRTSVKFQTMAYSSISNDGGIFYAKTKGDLKLKQNNYLRISALPSTDGPKGYFEAGHSEVFEEIYDEFTKKRDLVTDYVHTTMVVPGEINKEGTVTVEMNINIPSYEEVLYGQPSYENLKFKWIEYLALFIPTSFILYAFLNFIFSNRVFNCSVTSDIPALIN